MSFLLCFCLLRVNKYSIKNSPQIIKPDIQNKMMWHGPANLPISQSLQMLSRQLLVNHCVSAKRNNTFFIEKKRQKIQSFLTSSPAECIYPSPEKGGEKQRQPVWAEPTGTSEHVAWRRHEGERGAENEKKGYKWWLVEERGWTWVADRLSWSSRLQLYPRSYPMMGGELPHCGGASTLPQAISHVSAVRGRLRWQVMQENYSPPSSVWFTKRCLTEELDGERSKCLSGQNEGDVLNDRKRKSGKWR